MIEVSVPRDIREYEPTVIGTLTARQLVCSVALVLMVYGGWFLEKAIGIADPVSEAPFLFSLQFPHFSSGGRNLMVCPLKSLLLKHIRIISELLRNAFIKWKICGMLFSKRSTRKRLQSSAEIGRICRSPKAK